jgi:predicted SpoU family rRNA methylase
MWDKTPTINRGNPLLGSSIARCSLMVHQDFSCLKMYRVHAAHMLATIAKAAYPMFLVAGGLSVDCADVLPQRDTQVPIFNPPKTQVSAAKVFGPQLIESLLTGNIHPMN